MRELVGRCSRCPSHVSMPFQAAPPPHAGVSVRMAVSRWLSGGLACVSATLAGLRAPHPAPLQAEMCPGLRWIFLEEQMGLLSGHPSPALPVGG